VLVVFSGAIARALRPPSNKLIWHYAANGFEGSWITTRLRFASEEREIVTGGSSLGRSVSGRMS